MAKFRLFGWFIFAIALTAVIYFVAPQQLPVSIYKISLVSIGGVLGYWLDRSLFPYARPDYLLKQVDFQSLPNEVAARNFKAFDTSTIRRAIIVAAVILAVGLGA